MAEVRDPAIKLFGRRIPVVEAETGSDDKDIHDEATCTEVNASTSTPEELDQGKRGSKVNEDNHQISNQNDKATVDQKSDQDQTETEADASDQGKVLKKPDKILPCPRCNSMDTKFCYYNNYNVNQPRHFCKNCQRYWTAGGTMRNVPVGAGRRKNKHSASHLRQLDSASHLRQLDSASHLRQLAMPSDGLVANRADAPDSSHQALPCISIPTGPLKGNGTVLKFGPEAPLCESMASVLNLQEHNRNSAFNPISCGDNQEEPSCASSNCVENGFPNGTVRIEPNHTQVYCNEATPMQPIPCYPGNPWPYPWGPSWNNVAAAAVVSSQCSEFAYGQENGRPSTISWSGLPPNMAAAAFYGPAIPIPFMPASFWGCMPGWTSGTWNVPWVGPNCGPSSTSSTGNASSGCGSPTLGKHSRDASSQAEEKTEKSLWVPKTLRIDDPDEAAKSSIWATLGINPNEGGIFKDFRSKSQVKGQSSDTTQVLHANPAALSRFQSFQEST